MNDDEEARDKVVEDLIPSHWNSSPYRWAIQLRDLARTLPGVEITGSGTSEDTADFSFKVDGETFWVTVQSLGKAPQ